MRRPKLLLTLCALLLIRGLAEPASGERTDDRAVTTTTETVRGDSPAGEAASNSTDMATAANDTIADSANETATDAALGTTTIAPGDEAPSRGDRTTSAPETDESDDGTTTAGGDTTASGGDTTTSGGDTTTSGGDTAASGGDTAASGGDTASSGGETTTSEGGQTSAEGDTVTTADNTTNSDSATTTSGGKTTVTESDTTTASATTAGSGGANTTSRGEATTSGGDTTTAKTGTTASGEATTTPAGEASGSGGNTTTSQDGSTTAGGSTTVSEEQVPPSTLSSVRLSLRYMITWDPKYGQEDSPEAQAKRTELNNLLEPELRALIPEMKELRTVSMREGSLIKEDDVILNSDVAGGNVEAIERAISNITDDGTIGTISVSVNDTVVRLINCTNEPPSALQNGQLSWNGLKTLDVVATYTCNAGFRLMASNGLERANVTSTCKKAGDVYQFGSLDSSLSCVASPTTTTVAATTVTDRPTTTEPPTTADPRPTPKETPYVPSQHSTYKNSLFLSVTLPAVAGILCFLICCLCAIRIDSILCRVCAEGKV